MSPDQEVYEIPTIFDTQEIQDAFVRVMRFIPFAVDEEGMPRGDTVQHVDEVLYGWLGIDREFLPMFVTTRPTIEGVNYGNPNNIPSPNNFINDNINTAVAHRKEWLYEHEPSITGETFQQRRQRAIDEARAARDRARTAAMNARQAEYNRRTRRGAHNPYAGPRRRHYTRHAYNSNSEGSWESENSRNYNDRMEAAFNYEDETRHLLNNDGYSTNSRNNRNNNDEYPFPPETQSMTNNQFAKWLRTQRTKAPLEPSLSLNGFFNEKRNLQGKNTSKENEETRHFFTPKKNTPKKTGPVESAW